MTAALPPVQGHDALRSDLARAIDRNELPGSILLYGPPGVGRQRLGLWLAQRLVCERPAGTEPCDGCDQCRFALRLEHPDIHWFFPLPRPKASGDRLADALEDARAAELQTRREDPWRIVAPGEAVGLYVAQVRTLRRIAQARPAMGRRKVFLVADAELLVPQESSQEAANALLKLLEEPPPDTTLILTASGPDTLLPTLRSRLLPLRVRPLPEADVRRILVEVRGAPEGEADRAARLAQGSVGRALGFLPDGGEPGPLETLRGQARILLAAAVTSDPVAIYAAAHGLGTAGARGAFRDTLDFLTLWLRDLAAVASGAEQQVINADALDFLRRAAAELAGPSAGASAAILAVERARGLAGGNVNPQLTAARMLREIRSALAGAPVLA